MRASIKSVHDGGELIFSNVRRSPKGELLDFEVSVRSGNLQCSIKVYGYMSDGLPEYFSQLDKLMTDTGGWDNYRDWSSLESEITLSASSDSLGHITLEATLKSGRYDYDLGWRVSARILLEAGQLRGIAKDVQRVFDNGVP